MVTWNVHVDISKDTIKGKNGVYKSWGTYKYKGSCGCTITLRKEVEPSVKADADRNEEKEKLENYKFYYHTIPENWEWLSIYYQLKRVEYNGVAQTGLDGMGSLSTYREVCVIYWLNDYANIFPLMIGLGAGHVTHYKRKNGTTNEWEKASIAHPATLSEYQRVLSELNTKFNDVVIVNLNADKDKKYCGHPSFNCFKSPTESSSSCSHNGTTFVIVTVSEITGGTVPNGFKGFKHSPSGNKMRLLGTYHGNSMISFKESVISTEYDYVNAYYTSGSRGDKPLLLELQEHQGTSKLYTLGNKGEWVPSNLSKNDLTKVLDQENCLRNNIVVADLSNKRGRYCCGMSRHRKIQVEQHRNNVPAGYTSYLHLPNGASFNIHRFKSVDHTHTFTNFYGQITGIYAYFCNKDGKHRPILLYVNKGSGNGKWFKRTSEGGNNWTDQELSSLKTHTPSFPNIKQHIEEELKKVCKEFGIVCEHSPLTSPSGAGSGSSSGSGSSAGGLGSASVSPQQAGAGNTSDSGSGSVPAAKPGGGADEGLGGGDNLEPKEDNPESIGGPPKEHNAGGFIQKALTFITSKDGIITASVTSVITTGGMGGITYSCLKRRKL
ncbi:hypothetical protein BEWA_029650 [Theileria equi strain WA]|uniref:Uncharacterized protein n=1 Tax=Theileria equi strain WA TaxID=1537102 RepID=L0AYZ1_THEEQ|nr:hypothetical protein BEWA_029650 [Theileria equi strain WA]AFZ80114.1 hypothetical protein BEWA_029650 [Theileria equi strain WA]|eukprot:XP_004829780.1 hypothetical protein BEWA_029650 [Theileria equi strain WA]